MNGISGYRLFCSLCHFMQNIQYISLTGEEKHILKLICMEFSSNDIARELNVSILDINQKRKQIIAKINVKSNIGLLKYAIFLGLIENYVYQTDNKYSLN
jgi:DNA-binding CsgD family transcriptional regulator